MKRVIRILLWVIVLVIVIAGMALAALYLLADPNKLKPVLTNEVLQRTGYKLVIDGDLSWSIYPKVGVKADRVTVTAPKMKAPFLDLHKVNIAVEATQLLAGVSKVSGEVHIADVKLMNIHATSALVGLNWQNKKLTLRPVKASLYDGSLSGTINGQDFASTPSWTWDVNLAHVKLGPLLKDAEGRDAKLKVDGLGQVRIRATTSGLTSSQLLSNVNGVADFSVNKGVLHGVDLNFLLKTADALINQKHTDAPDDVHQTAFESLDGSALISNGVVKTNNLLLVSEAFKVKGQGTYNLPRHSVDMALQLESKDLNTRWVVPILLSGDVEDPDVRLDMREINKLLAAKELNKVREKVKKEIKKKVPGKAGEILQNLIGD